MTRNPFRSAAPPRLSSSSREMASPAASCFERWRLREERPEALRAWAALESGDTKGARSHVEQALAWGAWCDLARIVAGGIEARTGDRAAAERAWAPVRERIAKAAPPEYVYRAKLATWERVHAFPAVERRLLDRLAAP